MTATRRIRSGKRVVLLACVSSLVVGVACDNLLGISGWHDSPGGTRDAAPEACAPATAEPCTAIPPFPGVQRVDGYGDDFCGVPALPFDPAKWQPVSLLDSVGPTPSFPGSTLQVAWTGGQDGALHVYAHIAKWPAVPQPADAGIFWGDAVEILVSTSAANLTGQTGGDKGAGHVLVAPIPPDSAQFFPANSGTSGETLARAEYATRLEPGVGYDVEVQIPWATLDASAPSPGSAIGFDAVVDIRVATEDGGDDWWQVALIVEALPVGVPPGGCGATNPSYQPYCDDRTWCTPVVQ